MRKIFLFFFLLPAAAWADPGKYAVECTSACVAQDQSTQPAGTIINVIEASAGFVPTDFAGNTDDVEIVPYAGQTIYNPPTQ